MFVIFAEDRTHDLANGFEAFFWPVWVEARVDPLLHASLENDKRRDKLAVTPHIAGHIDLDEVRGGFEELPERARRNLLCHPIVVSSVLGVLREPIVLAAAHDVQPPEMPAALRQRLHIIGRQPQTVDGERTELRRMGRERLQRRPEVHQVHDHREVEVLDRAYLEEPEAELMHSWLIRSLLLFPLGCLLLFLF